MTSGKGVVGSAVVAPPQPQAAALAEGKLGGVGFRAADRYAVAPPAAHDGDRTAAWGIQREFLRQQQRQQQEWRLHVCRQQQFHSAVELPSQAHPPSLGPPDQQPQKQQVRGAASVAAACTVQHAGATQYGHGCHRGDVARRSLNSTVGDPPPAPPAAAQRSQDPLRGKRAPVPVPVEVETCHGAPVSLAKWSELQPLRIADLEQLSQAPRASVALPSKLDEVTRSPTPAQAATSGHMDVRCPNWQLNAPGAGVASTMSDGHHPPRLEVQRTGSSDSAASWDQPPPSPPRVGQRPPSPTRVEQRPPSPQQRPPSPQHVYQRPPSPPRVEQYAPTPMSAAEKDGQGTEPAGLRRSPHLDASICSSSAALQGASQGQMRGSHGSDLPRLEWPSLSVSDSTTTAFPRQVLAAPAFDAHQDLGEMPNGHHGGKSSAAATFHTDGVPAAAFDAYSTKFAHTLSRGQDQAREQIQLFMESLKHVPNLGRSVRSNLPPFTVEGRQGAGQSVEQVFVAIEVRRQADVFHVSYAVCAQECHQFCRGEGPLDVAQQRTSDDCAQTLAPHGSASDGQPLPVPVEHVAAIDRRVVEQVGGNAAPAPNRLRVRVGTVDFHTAGAGGIFDSVSFRVLLSFGGERPAAALVAAGGATASSPAALNGLRRPRWADDGPVTRPTQLRYSRLVSEDGMYKTRFSCEFDEEIDLPWPPPTTADFAVVDPQSSSENSLPRAQLSADLWVERRSTIERLDSVLSMIGLGTDLPEYDRVWLGRAVAQLPPVGIDSMLYPWPVETDGVVSDGPVPKCMTLGIEWVTDPDELDSVEL